MSQQYFSMFLNLSLVISLMVIMYVLTKRFKQARNNSGKLVKILQVIPIGSKEKIVLLEANNSTILVGVTANHIETLQIVEKPIENEQNEQVNHPSFLQTINSTSQAGHYE